MLMKQYSITDPIGPPTHRLTVSVGDCGDNPTVKVKIEQVSCKGNSTDHMEMEVRAEDMRVLCDTLDTVLRQQGVP